MHDGANHAKNERRSCAGCARQVTVEGGAWWLQLFESGPKIKHEWVVVGATKRYNMALDRMPRNKGQR